MWNCVGWMWSTSCQGLMFRAVLHWSEVCIHRFRETEVVDGLVLLSPSSTVDDYTSELIGSRQTPRINDAYLERIDHQLVTNVFYVNISIRLIEFYKVIWSVNPLISYMTLLAQYWAVIWWLQLVDLVDYSTTNKMWTVPHPVRKKSRPKQLSLRVIERDTVWHNNKLFSQHMFNRYYMCIILMIDIQKGTVRVLSVQPAYTKKYII